MKGMVLAAGEGQRLRPLTLSRPKPMLPIAGKPGLEWILDWLKAYGIHEIAMNLSYKPEAVQNHFGDGSRFGVELTYSLEETILGTAGGVKRLAGFLTEPFVLVYGDVLTDLNLADLIAFHQSRPSGPRVTMSLYRVPNPTECGIVELDSEGRVTRLVEKPPADAVFSDLANAGVLVLEPEILNDIPVETFYDFSLDLFPRQLAAGIPFYGQPLQETDYLIDIGTPEKYERAQTEWPTPKMQRLLTEQSA